MKYGPLFIIDHKPFYLAEFDEILALNECVRHIALTGVPISVDEAIRVKMLDFDPWYGTVTGSSDYPAVNVPAILVHQGVTTSVGFRFVPELRVYAPVQ